MQWSDEWIGLRYAEGARGPDAFDCLGLFIALQKARHDREIPDPACSIQQAVRRRVVAGMKASGAWLPVDRPEAGDALLFRVGRHVVHVGYCLGPRLMLHTEREGPGSVIEDFTFEPWRARLNGVFRFNA
ncbi:NlpC/P60 family protein [Roseivivax sp. THAF40]|uniref:C40 family peptidase n=1 Tax=Roseivivax sp. THAF40 TaxID=2587858 RepID=UPI001267D7B6|nr:NlpC/P60 family protein [Roseivivax sp. THAF40]QFT47807.1 NlpC/P60 family protein [Roseivivax sp. THAF40]